MEDDVDWATDTIEKNPKNKLIKDFIFITFLIGQIVYNLDKFKQ